MKSKTVWFVIWSTIAIITSVLFLIVPFYAPRVQKEAYRQGARIETRQSVVRPAPALSRPGQILSSESSTFTSGK